MTRTLIATALTALIVTGSSAQAMSGYVKLGTIKGQAEATDDTSTQTRQQNRRVELGLIKN